MTDRPKVVVTGAGGFIGGRVVEMLHRSGAFTVTALVRRWESAVRIAREPVDIQRCDLRNAADVERALRGAAYVVHCATAGPEVDVEGTRHVLAAAARHGVRRVVYLSTVAVFGEDVEGTVSEATPPGAALTPYGRSKTDAEAVCREFIAQGVPLTVLRPTIVYGPFSEGWVVEFVSRMRKGRWLLPSADCQGPCNLVYVDDLVAAIEQALTDPRAVGETFIVNGPDHVTWQDYFVALNRAAGFPELRAQSRAASHVAAAVMMPVRKTAKLLLQRFKDPILTLYKRNALIRRLMKQAESAIRQTPTTGEFGLYSRQVRYSAEKIERVLEFRPRVSMARGLELVGPWLKHHRYS
jgi:nucleoside-diphosphate-sugar epimerase